MDRYFGRLHSSMGTVGRLGHLMLEVGKVVKGWAGNLVGTARLGTPM